MDNSISKVGSGEANSNVAHHNSVPKLKTYGFAIAILLVIGLAVGAGALSNMTKLDAIITMTACGGSGVILLIISRVVKHRKNLNHQPSTIGHQSSTIVTPINTAPVDVSQQPIDTKGGLFYGLEAWRKLKVEVVEVVPPPPDVDLRGEDKVLLYIPRTVIFNHIKRDFTLITFQTILMLQKIGSLDIRYSDPKNFEDIQGSGRWVLIDKVVRAPSMRKDLGDTTPQQAAEAENCSLPSLLEAAVLNLMVHAFTGEEVPSTHCFEPQYSHLATLTMSRDYGNSLNLKIYVPNRTSKMFLCARRNFPKVSST